MIIRITDFQRSNLLQFLQRTELKGSEVEAFVEVIQVIQSATDNEPPAKPQP